MKIFKFIIYSAIFLLTFGRFVPAYNAPDAVVECFGSGKMFAFAVFVSFCFFLLRIISILCLSRLDWKKHKRPLLNSIALTIIYFSLIFSIPVLQDVQNKFVIWVNHGRDIEHLINPTLGMSMIMFEAEENKYVDEIEFTAFARRSGTPYRLIFTPSGIEKSRWRDPVTDQDDNLKIYNNQWQWVGNNKSFFSKPRLDDDEHGFTIE